MDRVGSNKIELAGLTHSLDKRQNLEWPPISNLEDEVGLMWAKTQEEKKVLEEKVMSSLLST